MEAIMYKNSREQNDIIQNQFSAYVKTAIRNRRIRYLTNQSKRVKNETAIVEYEIYLYDNDDYIQRMIDFDCLKAAFRLLNDKERRIVISHLIEDKSFSEIAQELQMTYKGVTSLYYRTIKKIQYYFKGGD